MKPIINILIIALLITVPGSPNLTGNAKDLSLKDAVAIALEKNFNIQIARQDMNISRNNNTWGNAGRYPTLDSGVQLSNTYSDSPSLTEPNRRTGNSSTDLSGYIELRWILFQGFRVKIRKAQLNLLDEQKRGLVRKIIQDTVKQITLSYYRVLLEHEKLTVMEQVLQLSHDRYQKELEKQKFGSATTYQVLQFKTAWLEDQSRSLTQKTASSSALRELNYLMGNKRSESYRLTGSLSVQTPDYRFPCLYDKLLANNQVLKNLRYQIAVLKKDIALQKSGYYPSISLNSGIRGYTLDGLSNATSYNCYADIGIQYNLFNGNNTRREVANASIALKKARLQLEQNRLQLEKLLIDTLETYNARKQVFTVTVERQQTAALSLDLSKQKLGTGAIDSFNYRDVQMAYLNASLEKLQAIYDLIDSLSSIELLTSGGI